jgi:hypothetical protein
VPRQPTQGDDQRNLEWVRIDDFTPGCYDQSFISVADPKLSAPLGAADALATFACAAMSSGPLGPLPAIVHSETYPSGLPGTATEAWLVGFAVNPGLDQNAPELLLIYEADDGTNHFAMGFSVVPGIATNSFFDVIGPTQAGIFGSPYPVWTRMSGTPVPSNPPPALIFPGYSLLGGGLYEYPNPAFPTSFGLSDLTTEMGAGITGQVIAYGDRILVLAGVDYPWPSGGGINTNENINFTDPPLSNVYGNQQTILGAEEPWGYGAWGSVSVGELMLIKKYGGGIALYGDIDAPTSAIDLPGIESTGGFVGSALATQIGLVYCSQNRGSWLWNGGNSSTKISPQLRDDFFDVAGPLSMPSNNYGFYVGRWQDWILFSNNYLYNAETNSWWVLYPNKFNGTGDAPGETFFWFIQGNLGKDLYAVPLQIGTGAGQDMRWWYRFDNTVAAPHWQWKSLPIHVTKNADRVLDVRQVVIRVSDPSASGTATATVSIGSFSATTTEVIGQEPTPFRFNVGQRGLDDIVIQVNGDNGSGSSPVLHSIDIGYQVRAGVAVDN